MSLKSFETVVSSLHLQCQKSLKTLLSRHHHIFFNPFLNKIDKLQQYHNSIYDTFSFPSLLFSPNVISAIYFTFIVGAWLEVPREGFQIGWTRSPSSLTLATHNITAGIFQLLFVILFMGLSLYLYLLMQSCLTFM